MGSPVSDASVGRQFERVLLTHSSGGLCTRRELLALGGCLVAIGVFMAILAASRGQAETSYIRSNCVGGVSSAQESECAAHVDAQHAANRLLVTGGAVATGGVIVFLFDWLMSRKANKGQVPGP
jgi:hypothetical protein